MRARTPQRKRFYAKADVSKPTAALPSRSTASRSARPRAGRWSCPVREIADAIAAEWQAQKETIDPLTMPLTRFANSVVRGRGRSARGSSPTTSRNICTPIFCSIAPAIRKRWSRARPRHWDPVLFWAADTLGAHFILAEGIVHVRQPDSAVDAARAAFPADPWSIAALHVVTTLTGSALLALALLHGVLDPDQVWAAAHVDEDWNADKWGVDEEVAARRAARLVDFEAAAFILRVLGPL